MTLPTDRMKHRRRPILSNKQRSIEHLESRIALSATQVETTQQSALEPELAELAVAPIDPILLDALQQQLAVINEDYLQAANLYLDDVDPAILEYNDLQVRREFEYASNLGNYTQEQLADTSLWVVRLFDGEALADVDGEIGAAVPRSD